MEIYDLLASDNYIILNKTLIKKLGLKEAVMYCELVSEYRYFSSKDQLNEYGEFFSTVENVEENTTLGKTAQSRALKSLKELGLIDTVKRGIPAKRFIKLNQQALTNLLLNNKHVQSGTNSTLILEPMDGAKYASNNNNLTILSNSINLKDKEIQKKVDSGSVVADNQEKDSVAKATSLSETQTMHERENKDNQFSNQVEMIIDYLNSKADTRYRANTAKTQRLIRARMKEGFSLNDFKTVIDNKVADWKDNLDMVKYLRPETLFGTKFEGYLNETHKQPTGYTYADYYTQENIQREQAKYRAEVEQERQRMLAQGINPDAPHTGNEDELPWQNQNLGA